MTSRSKATGNKKNPSYVIASNRPWNREMVQSLAQKTGHSFVLISKPAELTEANLHSINPRLVFFPHWSHHINSSIFTQFECVIFHSTDLPFGRGGSPIQNLIARGINETMITALRCVEEMDAGPIYLKKPLSLYGSAEEIFLRASSIIESMIVEMLEKSTKPEPQEGKVVVFGRRKPEQSTLVSAQTLEQAFNHIRMLDAEGYPSAFVEYGPFTFEFTRASIKTDHVLADVRISLTKDTKKQS